MSDAIVAPEVVLDEATMTRLAASLAGELTLPEDSNLHSDLCISFNRNGIDPIWGIDWVQINRAEP